MKSQQAGGFGMSCKYLRYLKRLVGHLGQFMGWGTSKDIKNQQIMKLSIYEKKKTHDNVETMKRRINKQNIKPINYRITKSILNT